MLDLCLVLELVFLINFFSRYDLPCFVWRSWPYHVGIHDIGLPWGMLSFSGMSNTASSVFPFLQTHLKSKYNCSFCTSLRYGAHFHVVIWRSIWPFNGSIMLCISETNIHLTAGAMRWTWRSNIIIWCGVEMSGEGILWDWRQWRYWTCMIWCG